MTGPLRNLARPFPIIRLAVLPLLALVSMLVTGDNVHAAGTFNPVNGSTYCAEGATIDDQQVTVASCTPDASPGSHPDIVGTFDIGLGADGQAGTGDDTGDYNFGGVVNLSPTVPDDNAIPVGAILGRLASQPTLGLVNNSCSNNQLRPAFTFMKGTTDINNTVEPIAFGLQNDLALMSGDNAPYDGKADIDPPPAVTKYPSFLNAIFDADYVDYGPDKIAGNADDNNGPSPPIKPVFRAVGTTSISAAGNLWVILQLVVFDKGTKLPNLPKFEDGYGYPSVVVLQTASAAGSATPPAPSAVTDFCSPLKTVNVSYGTTKDHPVTPANEGGIPVRTLPEAGAADACDKSPPGPGCIVGFAYGPSQRDADGDGYENGLDPCPFHADTVWNPRDLTAPTEGDSDAGVSDGLPDTCDPTPAAATSENGGQPTDHDADGFLNRGDNCPLVYNLDQNDKDIENGEEVGDGIGDACDKAGTEAGSDCVGSRCGDSCPFGTPPCQTGPLPIPARSVAGKGEGTPDGDQILCVKVSTIVVGGDPNVKFTDCLGALPPLGQLPPPGGGGASQTGTGTGTGTGGGTTAGGVGGPSSGIGSLSPVGGSVPAWAAIAAGLGAAGLIGSLGTLASRLVRRRREL